MTAHTNPIGLTADEALIWADALIEKGIRQPGAIRHELADALLVAAGKGAHAVLQAQHQLRATADAAGEPR